MRRFVNRLIIFSVLAGTPLITFYWHYEQIAKELIIEAHYSAPKANAVKHAYAAMQIYQLLNYVAPNESAVNMTLALGVGNERFEQLIRGTKRDATIEIMKDLHNNQVGITAAQSIKKLTLPPSLRPLDVIRTLADNRTMIDDAEAIHPRPAAIAHHPHDVDVALEWFAQEQTSIITRTEAALNQLR